MTKRTQLIGRSPRMEQVINLVSRPEFMRILESAYEPERNTFTDRRGGYGGGGGYEYNGYFKITDASEGDTFKVKVVDGKNPKGENCGYTDIGIVPVTILDNPADKLIILSAEYDTEAQNYKLEIVAKTEAEVKGLCYFLLAEVKSDRSILQRWEAGTINFGERYVI